MCCCWQFVFEEGLAVYTDASCVLPKHLGLARAGIAAVQLNSKMQLVKAVCSPLPLSFYRQRCMESTQPLQGLYCTPTELPD